MDWNPEPVKVKGMLRLLKELSADPRDDLDEFCLIPEFRNYLAMILTTYWEENVKVRLLCADLLKMVCARTAENCDYVKYQLLSNLNDREPRVRTAIAHLIASLAVKFEFHNWEELFPTLFEHLDSQDIRVCETVSKTCQIIFLTQSRKQLYFSNDLMLPISKFFKNVMHRNTLIRCCNISSLNSLMELKSTCIIINAPQFADILLQYVHETDKTIIKHMIQSFDMLIDLDEKFVVKKFPQICDFIMKWTYNSDALVVFQACEFWLNVAEHNIPEINELLLPHLGSLVRIIFNHLIHGVNTPYVIESGNFGYHISGGDDSGASESPFVRVRYDIKDYTPISVDMSGIDVGGSEESYNLNQNWDLRQCGIILLDKWALIYDSDLQKALLPLIYSEMDCTEWLILERTILCIGILAKTSENLFLSDQIHSLIHFVIQSLDHEKIIIRSICLWTLNRYTDFFVCNVNDIYLTYVISAIMRSLLDSEKVIRVGGQTVLHNIITESRYGLTPVIGSFTSHISHYLSFFVNKCCMGMNIDVHFTKFLEKVSQKLESNQYLTDAVTNLQDLWMYLNTKSPTVNKILLMLQDISRLSTMSFQPFIEKIYATTLSKLEANVAVMNQSADVPSSEDSGQILSCPRIRIVSFDIVCSLLETCSVDLEKCIVESNLLNLMYPCAKDSHAGVRTAVFCLLGCLVINLYPQIGDYIPQFMPNLIHNLLTDEDQVGSNCVWTLNQIIDHMKGAFSQFVQRALPPLIMRLNSPTVTGLFLRNVVICLGKICYWNPQEAVPFSHRFMKSFLKHIPSTVAISQQSEIYFGLSNIIALKYNVVVPFLKLFCECIAFDLMDDDPMNIFKDALQKIKDNHWRHWELIRATFTDDFNEKFHQMYNV